MHPMQTLTSVVAAATSDQKMIDTIDQVAGKGATWWLAAIGVVLMAGLAWMFKWMVDQNRTLFVDLKSATSREASDLREVVAANTIAMTKVAGALEDHSRRLDSLEDAMRTNK